MEACVISYVSGHLVAAGDVLDLVLESVPRGKVLVRGRKSRGFAGRAVDDERIEVDHGNVVVEESEDGFWRQCQYHIRSDEYGLLAYPLLYSLGEG